MSQKRVAEAEAILRRAAKRNKVEAPVVIFRDYDEQVRETYVQLQCLLTLCALEHFVYTLCPHIVCLGAAMGIKTFHLVIFSPSNSC